MAGPRISEWRKLPMSLTELCIDTTLRCGQAFRWRKVGDEWHCTLQGRILSLKQDSTHLHYRATWPSTSPSLTFPTPHPSHIPSPSLDPKEEEKDDTLPLLTSYFNLPISLATLYRTWSSADPNFARRSSTFAGIRILNQPAWEALVAFICSSNNHISRISSMVSKLCVEYGPYIGTIATTGSEDGGRGGEEARWHDFPTSDALAGEGVEQRLRELGFGYRAGYLVKTARMVRDNGGEAWLLGLRNPASLAIELAGGQPEGEEEAKVKVKAEVGNDGEGEGITYKAAHEALLTLSGVGPKVADCVCLMGLGWHEAVPVDTHVWQIAQRDYKFGGGKSKTKTFNKAVHDAVGDHFRGIWGEYAGWAQSVLFTANLRSFAEQAAAGGGGGGGKIEEGDVVKKEEEGSERVVGAVKTEKIKVEAKVKIEEAEGVRGFVKMEEEVKIEETEGIQKLESIEHDDKDVKKEGTDQSDESEESEESESESEESREWKRAFFRTLKQWSEGGYGPAAEAAVEEKKSYDQWVRRRLKLHDKWIKEKGWLNSNMEMQFVNGMARRFKALREKVRAAEEEIAAESGVVVKHEMVVKDEMAVDEGTVLKDEMEAKEETVVKDDEMVIKDVEVTGPRRSKRRKVQA